MEREQLITGDSCRCSSVMEGLCVVRLTGNQSECWLLFSGLHIANSRPVNLKQTVGGGASVTSPESKHFSQKHKMFLTTDVN